MSQKIQEEILRGKQQTFGDFIWNGETGQFLGRTGTSWGKIFAFYVVYYGFLAGFFALCMFLFYQTLDTVKMPKYSPGDKSSILKNPSLGYRPRPTRENIESSMIYYSSDDPKSFEKWTSSINDLIEGKENPRMQYLTKTEGDNIKETCSFTDYPDQAKEEVCDYDISQFKDSECNKANDWGYSSDSPCILLKLNRMIGWAPDVYKTVDELPKDMPKQLSEHITSQADVNGTIPQMLWISCEGESPMDQEMLGDGVKYAPTQGIPLYYFPYNNQENYISPILAVQFVNPKPNILIHVRCTLYAKQITYNNKDAIGLVGFQILIDKLVEHE